jgi:2-dehydro-3-deoxyphosphogluconate aldolase/(4S)-4-hydroxy-2-oxoglutarate aldolase
MTLFEFGYSIQKFFPAEPAGGVAYLKALGSPLPGIRFCPDRGSMEERLRRTLALLNVICVGDRGGAARGSGRGDWDRIERLAQGSGWIGARGMRPRRSRR